MAMPDFSFLQNQQGNTAFGSLAQGLAKGAELGANLKNMQAQQAAQQEQIKLHQNQFQLDQMKFVQDVIANNRKQELIGNIALNTKGLPPAEVAKTAAGIASTAGDGALAEHYATVYDKLSSQTPNKPLFQDFEFTDPKTQEVFTIKGQFNPNDPGAIDPGMEKYGLKSPGFQAVGAPVKKESSLVSKLADALTKQDNQLLNDVAKMDAKNIADNANAAEVMLNGLEVFKQEASQVGQVMFPRYAEKLGALAKFLGMDVDVSNIAAANRAQNQLMYAYLKKTGGNDTAQEMGVAFDSVPSLMLDPEARKHVIAVAERAAQRELDKKIQHDKFLVNSVNEKGGGISLKDGTTWEEHWNKYKKEHPVVTKEDKKVFDNTKILSGDYMSTKIDRNSGRRVIIMNDQGKQKMYWDDTKEEIPN